MYNLSPYDFDQTDKGWRNLDVEGKYLDAAKSIENYIAANKQTIESGDQASIQTMYFHAGQEYAMAGAEYYTQALKNFEKSYKNKADWDTYVDGTIAFISGDMEKLKAAAMKLNKLAESDARLRSNAELLESFLQALMTGDNYAKVYDDQL